MPSLSDAVTAELALMDRRKPGIASSALAVLAVSLAEGIDDSRPSLTAKSMCAGQLRAALEDLRGMLPEEKTRDALDDAQHRTDERRLALVRDAARSPVPAPVDGA